MQHWRKAYFASTTSNVTSEPLTTRAVMSTARPWQQWQQGNDTWHHQLPNGTRACAWTLHPNHLESVPNPSLRAFHPDPHGKLLAATCACLSTESTAEARRLRSTNSIPSALTLPMPSPPCQTIPLRPRLGYVFNRTLLPLPTPTQPTCPSHLSAPHPSTPPVCCAAVCLAPAPTCPPP